MKPNFLSLLMAVLLAPAAALAAGDVDANDDGILTLEEVQAAYPEISTGAFGAMDANADGALDQEEVAAAQKAGLLPLTEG